MRIVIVCIVVLLLCGCNAEPEAVEQGDRYVYTEPTGNTALAEKIRYKVVTENGYLNLYQEDSVKKSEPFNAQLYPAEDVKELENGVLFDDIESAFEFLESYLS